MDARGNEGYEAQERRFPHQIANGGAWNSNHIGRGLMGCGFPRPVFAWPDDEDCAMIRVAFVIGDYPPDQRRLREDVAKSYSSADVEVGILSVPARPFDGLTPAEIQAAAPIFHESFRDAERQGFDAVVPLGMLDLGVE